MPYAEQVSKLSKGTLDMMAQVDTLPTLMVLRRTAQDFTPHPAG